MNVARSATPRRFGIGFCQREGIDRNIGAEATRTGQFGKQREQDAARSRAEIEQIERPLATDLCLDEIERSLDQRLGVGPRVERTCRRP